MVKTKTDVWYGSVKWANEVLSYAIQVLKGRILVSLPKGRLYIALLIKEELERSGFLWHSDVLNIWICRFQRGDFSECSERSERRSGAERSARVHKGGR